MKFPNEKKEDYIKDEYYVYGRQCLNCGEVNRHIVPKDGWSWGEGDYATEEFIHDIRKREGNYSYGVCEHCGLYTKQEMIALTPPEED